MTALHEGIYLDVELDEVDGEAGGLVEGAERVLLYLLQPPVRRRQRVHPLPPMPDHHQPLRRSCSTGT
ncbi:hypothetical protein GW17_00030939 [Ensete ventricosum]|nr:hypothetical protein GW17_00030939 [Ensete ventricosum]